LTYNVTESHEDRELLRKKKAAEKLLQEKERLI